MSSGNNKVHRHRNQRAEDTKRTRTSSAALPLSQLDYQLVGAPGDLGSNASTCMGMEQYEYDQYLSAAHAHPCISNGSISGSDFHSMQPLSNPATNVINCLPLGPHGHGHGHPTAHGYYHEDSTVPATMPHLYVSKMGKMGILTNNNMHMPVPVPVPVPQDNCFLTPPLLQQQFGQYPNAIPEDPPSSFSSSSLKRKPDSLSPPINAIPSNAVVAVAVSGIDVCSKPPTLSSITVAPKDRKGERAVVDHTYRDFSGVQPSAEDREMYERTKEIYAKRSKNANAAPDSCTSNGSSAGSSTMCSTKTATASKYPTVQKSGRGNKANKNTDFSGCMGTNFPARLHDLLSHEEAIGDVIAWLPHGRSWIVRDKERFIEKVASLRFQMSKIESFSRQVNAWGFKRITQGPDINSYYHELFLKGMPHLVRWMKRSPPSSCGQNKRLRASPNDEPNFYAISEQFPIPDYYHENGGKPITTISSSNKSGRHRSRSSRSQSRSKKVKIPLNVPVTLSAPMKNQPVAPVTTSQEQEKAPPRRSGGLRRSGGFFHNGKQSHDVPQSKDRKDAAGVARSATASQTAGEHQEMKTVCVTASDVGSIATGQKSVCHSTTASSCKGPFPSTSMDEDERQPSPKRTKLDVSVDEIDIVTDTFQKQAVLHPSSNVIEEEDWRSFCGALSSYLEDSEDGDASSVHQDKDDDVDCMIEGTMNNDDDDDDSFFRMITESIDMTNPLDTEADHEMPLM